MATFSFIISTADGRQHVNVTEFDDDASAIKAAGDVVDAEHPSVAVSRGAGDEVRYLGAWDFDDGRAVWWEEA